MSFNITIIQRFWQLLLSGVPVILYLSLASAFFGTLIGLATVFLRRMNKVFNAIVAAYIDLFRGTPVYVQMFVIYFGIPGLIGLNINNWVAAILVFSLNSGAYMSEIMRAGIDGIDKGQIEAAKALGVSATDIAKDIIIPQAFRNVLPAVINEFITLTKETSIVSVLGLHDMMYWFYAVKNQTYADFEPLLIVFLVYYIMNKILSLIGKMIERKLKYD
ncbi:amino acid ABC transporter permease [[Clostridium] innocuum]|nr:amino acid ABC transporter permease [[Clostridium] innocuum]